jgi:hypothetical protein
VPRLASCTERIFPTSSISAVYLTENDLEDIAERYALEWDEVTDGPLPLALPNPTLDD